MHLNIVEIRKPEIDAKLVADNIAQQLERRVAFRRAMKRAVQSAMRLGRIGFDRVEGFLEGGLSAATSVLTTDRLSPRAASDRMAGTNAPLVIDVRTPRERAEKSISGTTHRPLNTFISGFTDIARDRPLIVFCAGGYRSSIAASLLQREGFTNVSELAGGIAAWEAAGLPLSGSGQST